MAELHETRMGKTLIDSTFPKIAKQLERIANSLEYIENSISSVLYIDSSEKKSDLGGLINSFLEENRNGKS